MILSSQGRFMPLIQKAALEPHTSLSLYTNEDRQIYTDGLEYLWPKYHTLRKDPGNRWKPSNKIHLWKGSPRNPTKNPYQFAQGICAFVQSIKIRYDKGIDGAGEEYTVNSPMHQGLILKVYAGQPMATVQEFQEQADRPHIYDKVENRLTARQIALLAKNDGFGSVYEFMEFFPVSCNLKLISWNPAIANLYTEEGIECTSCLGKGSLAVFGNAGTNNDSFLMPGTYTKCPFCSIKK